MEQSAAKQQIVERIKQASTILVTVSQDPDVDQLAACIGSSLFLNKLGKHATAVFSGRVPSTIEFLEPEKTIETSPDSLRDFIISLDKSKADKLRYKVEGDVVKIFITPYKTKISEADLKFSEGEINVEVVLALGVQSRTQIDAAITAHGRILHDATVITINAGDTVSNVGQLNWQDPNASSLCEMLVSISEAFGTGHIDNQMATAFLTGIVAKTERFSNDKTSPRVMTMSAQLMAAGANQALIAAKLEGNEPLKVPQDKSKADSGVMKVPKEVAKPLAKDEIHIDEKGNLAAPDIKAQPKTELPPIDLPPPASPQAYMDTEARPPSRPVFSAGTAPSDDTAKPVDPLSPDADVHSARSAVENAIAALPHHPAIEESAELGAQTLNEPVSEETPVVPPAPANGTPSLQLPTNGAPAPAAPAPILPPAPATPPPSDRPAPPPVPPPLMPTNGQ